MRLTVPAGRGLACRVAAGETFRVLNPSGTQVVDFWAFPDVEGEHLSMGHSREVLQRFRFRPGDQLITDRYRPVLTFVADTSPGHHDTLIPACTPETYRYLEAAAGHRSCVQNLTEALGRRPQPVPQPWNLFMVTELDADGGIEYARPYASPGAEVELRADLAVTIVCSACPDDIYPTNGNDGTPRDAVLDLSEQR